MTDEQEFLMKQLETQLDMYKFYFELALKLSVFSIGLTGAIVSYYLANKDINQVFVFSLYVPAAVSGGLLALFMYGLKTIPPVQNQLEQISSELRQSFVYSVEPIRIFLRGLVLLNFCTVVGLVFIICKFYVPAK